MEPDTVRSSRVLVLGAAVALGLLSSPPQTTALQPCEANPLCIVTQEREKIPGTLTEDQAPDLLRAIAQRLNAEGAPGGPFGLLVKTTGTNCHGYSCDIVCAGQGAGQRQWDVLVDSQEPAWNEVDRARMVVRQCEIAGDTPLPPPPPPPACAECETERDLLRRANVQLQENLGQHQRRITDLELELDSTRGRALAAEQQRDEAREHARQLEERLANVRCEAKLPKWLGVGCRIIR